MSTEPSVLGGSAQPNANAQQLGGYEFSLPPLAIQKRIAEILGRLDDKIELNRRINATLEEMAQRLYKHWFVDFGPFQDGEFVESELGLIPQGWSVGKVGDFGTIVTGKTPSTQIKENFGDEVLFIKIPDMRDNVFVIDTDMKLSTLGASSQQNKLLPKMTICVSCIATPGLVSLTSKESQTNQQINSIIPNDLTHATFIYCQMLGMAEEIRLRGSGGTATLNLNKQDFSNLQIIKPSNNILYAFHEKSSHWFTQILNNQYQSRHLVTIRDYLLPRLLSGELSVEETANVP